jgi:2'-5' RNA ligase
MAKIRTFVCFEIPASILERLSSLQDKLKSLGSGISWTRPEGIHLTLKFLGDVEEAQIDAIASAVEKAVAEVKPFTVTVKGTGAFPDFRRPRVLWAGIEEAGGSLLKLQSRIDEELLRLGFPKEKRGFSAHLTMGRVKSTQAIEKITARLREESMDAGEFIAEEIIVMQSNLLPTGAVYTPLRTIRMTK